MEIYGETHLNKEYFESMQNFIKENNLKNIEFCGTTNDIESKLRESSVFAFPSAFEGFPLALTEAMSMGLPSIGFKSCPAVNDLIKDGNNGILCDDTVEALSHGLAELMDDAEKRKLYGAQAREDMKEYTPEKIWNRWKELIDETVSEYKKK